MQGINCRFGNRGVIAEAHYDGGRNFIAMLKGDVITPLFVAPDHITANRRQALRAAAADTVQESVFIPARAPRKCDLSMMQSHCVTYLIGRHAMGDWSQPDYDTFPLLKDAAYDAM